MFKNFQPQSGSVKKLPAPLPKIGTAPKPSQVMIVNGRRAVLKKRLRAKTAPAQFVDTQAQRENNLRAREEQLQSLRDHRKQLLLLQQGQPGARQSSVRSFSGFRQTQQETVRSSPTVSVSDPYVRGLNLADGSYSYSYGK